MVEFSDDDLEMIAYIYMGIAHQKEIFNLGLVVKTSLISRMGAFALLYPENEHTYEVLYKIYNHWMPSQAHFNKFMQIHFAEKGMHLNHTGVYVRAGHMATKIAKEVRARRKAICVPYIPAHTDEYFEPVNLDEYVTTMLSMDHSNIIPNTYIHAVDRVAGKKAKEALVNAVDENAIEVFTKDAHKEESLRDAWIMLSLIFILPLVYLPSHLIFLRGAAVGIQLFSAYKAYLYHLRGRSYWDRLAAHDKHHDYKYEPVRMKGIS